MKLKEKTKFSMINYFQFTLEQKKMIIYKVRYLYLFFKG